MGPEEAAEPDPGRPPPSRRPAPGLHLDLRGLEEGTGHLSQAESAR